ncbi:RecX family transcriptional regulator [Cellulophaga sp. F20128]|uniref:regulatory protein RecX n=1 Tax=Cellulophaga sp. F20128 TaxID=2926413 RepID=UPI001FF3C9CA|nr:regulatory protein RecX [Cellulophaga sp. F20128]MCK0158624.1 RecX family transcriptional regulator [Cellulophaga sp. F20128]
MNLQPSYTITEATKKLEYYCAYQERCHKEVTQKLKDMGMIPDAIDLVITHLITANFLNESRFAQSFARGKFSIKKWGKRRIVSELKQRHISVYNITLALKEISEDDYRNTLDVLAKKRLESIKETSVQKRRKKLADYLLYRGWESHLVYETISNLIK